MAIVDVVNAPTIDDAFLFLLTVRDDSVPGQPVVLRGVNNLEDVVSNGETFVAFPFNLTLPTDQGQRPQNVKLTVANIGRELVNVLRKSMSPPDVTIELVLSGDPDSIQKRIDFLTVASVSYNAETIEFTLATSSVFQRKTISATYHPSEFKSLFWGNG